MDKILKKEIFDLMITARCMEERMIKMSKSADGFFWLGGIGEEAFNIPLGLLAKRRPDEEDREPGDSALDHDFFHFHYRNGATMLAMGMDPKDQIRQMHNRATDPFSGGRNFCNHYAYKPWNVCPTSSTIQTQCSIAPGTARAQKRHGGEGITLVTFGDAGTAEGDFHTGLNWATLPDWELPLLFVCTNNSFGISTPYAKVHGQKQISDLAKGYGMKVANVDGLDVVASYAAIKQAMDYIRKNRKPYFLEASVSRLNGHSSSSGGNRLPEGIEIDPVHQWRDRLVEEGIIDSGYFDQAYPKETLRMTDILVEVRKEPAPQGRSIYDHIFAQA